MGKMLLSLSLTLVSNFDFDSECLVVNINIQNQDWQISFSKSKLNIQDYALGCQYQDSNSRFKSCISRLVLNFNICKFAWQYSIPKSKSLQTSNSTSISRILSISTSISTNINNLAHLCPNSTCIAEMCSQTIKFVVAFDIHSSAQIKVSALLHT